MMVETLEELISSNGADFNDEGIKVQLINVNS